MAMMLLAGLITMAGVELEVLPLVVVGMALAAGAAILVMAAPA